MSVIADQIAAERKRLLELSHALHADPELAFEEHRAAERITTCLETSGFAVTRGVGGLPTAFEASYGSGDLTVGICAEYDALDGIGHACGHNIIAASSVGAALALRPVADELDFRIKVIGTPAEERGGGKVLLLERGVFDDVTVAMMAHPMSVDLVGENFITQAVSRFEVTFTGRPAHAAAAPHLAINALDAAVLSLTAIGLLRQQIPGDHRIAAVIREGGSSINVVPEHTVVECEVRAFTMAEVDALQIRAENCFEAGALATGCELSMTPTQPAYAELKQDAWLSERYAARITALGRTLGSLPGGKAGGSTDMGNVSQAMPSIHPTIGMIGTTSMPHTYGFARDANTPAADQAVLDAAAALASCAADLAGDAEQRATVVKLHTERGSLAVEP